MLEIDATNNRHVRDSGGYPNEVRVLMEGAGTIIFSDDPSRATPASEVSEISWSSPDALKSAVELMRKLTKEAQLHPTRLALLDQAAAYLDCYRITMAASLLAE